MWTAASTTHVIALTFRDTGSILSLVVGTTILGATALGGLGYAFSKLSLYIYNYGGSIRRFGKKPWKGYNRFRSEQWNLEHTA